MSGSISDAIIMSMTDRSELTKLYPSIDKRTDNLSYKPIPRLTTTYDTKLTFMYMLPIAGLLTMSVVILVLFFNLLKQTIDASNIINLLPVIVVSIILWVGLLLFVLGSVSKRLNKIGVNNVFFIIVYALCALPVSQLIYNLYSRFNNGFVDIIPYALILFVVDLIFVSSILLFMRMDKLSGGAKKGLFIVVVAIGILATVISGA